MAISQLESNTVSRAINLARKLLVEIKPEVDALNIIYDSAGGVSSTLTQAELDGVTSFSGLTKQQVDDGMYAMTAIIRQILANGTINVSTTSGSYSALQQLACRG